MKNFGAWLLAVSLLAAAFSVPGTASAAGGVTVDHGAVEQTRKAGETTQAGVSIHNAGGSADVLTGWACSIAQATALVGGDGKALQALTIPPRQTVTLRASGPHLLLRGVRDAVVSGSVIPCDFTFQNAGDVAVYLNAVPAVKQGG